MKLNMQRWQEGGKTALKWESLRKLLIDKGLYTLALQTYSSQREFLPDHNSSEFWDEKFSQSEISHPMENWRIKFIVSKIQASKTVLNLGVGKGRLEKELFKKKQVKYVGTDITKVQLEKLKKEYPDKKFVATTLTDLNFEDESFEQVLLLEVLEHIKPSETFTVLKEIYRVLKKGGIFIISVPVNEGLENILPFNPNSHMRAYSEELLKFELKSVGFKIKEVARTSAFNNYFTLKHLLNAIFSLREPNNIIIVTQK
ncbi:MAG TPA: class I SAM-dependent methyltransferase [Patescibacteria group bacterium]